MSSRVCIAQSAAKQVKKLPRAIRESIIERLWSLEENPVPDDAADLSIDDTEVYMVVVENHRVGWAYHRDVNSVVVLFVDEVI